MNKKHQTLREILRDATLRFKADMDSIVNAAAEQETINAKPESIRNDLGADKPGLLETHVLDPDEAIPQVFAVRSVLEATIDSSGKPAFRHSGQLETIAYGEIEMMCAAFRVLTQIVMRSSEATAELKQQTLLTMLGDLLADEQNKFIVVETLRALQHDLDNEDSGLKKSPHCRGDEVFH